MLISDKEPHPKKHITKARIFNQLWAFFGFYFIFSAFFIFYFYFSAVSNVRA